MSLINSKYWNTFGSLTWERKRNWYGLIKSLNLTRHFSSLFILFLRLMNFPLPKPYYFHNLHYYHHDHYHHHQPILVLFFFSFLFLLLLLLRRRRRRRKQPAVFLLLYISSSLPNSVCNIYNINEYFNIFTRSSVYVYLMIITVRMFYCIKQH